VQTIQLWLKNQNQHTPVQQTRVSKNDLLLLLEHLLGKNRAWLYAHPEHQLTAIQIDQLTAWSQALQHGQPMAYITGTQMFWDLTFNVNSDTLIPRPDTEVLIDTVFELLEDNPPKKILDLGTGCGALAIVLAKTYSQANVLAIDQSAKALTMAKNNAKLNHVTNINFLQSNWFDVLHEQQFDLIVSNPPYIAADDPHLEALQHEPQKALVADQNGLGDFSRIATKAISFLTEGGLLIFEHGWQQHQQVQRA